MRNVVSQSVAVEGTNDSCARCTRRPVSCSLRRLTWRACWPIHYTSRCILSEAHPLSGYCLTGSDVTRRCSGPRTACFGANNWFMNSLPELATRLCHCCHSEHWVFNSAFPYVQVSDFIYSSNPAFSIEVENIKHPTISRPHTITSSMNTL